MNDVGRNLGRLIDAGFSVKMWRLHDAWWCRVESDSYGGHDHDTYHTAMGDTLCEAIADAVSWVESWGGLTAATPKEDDRG